MNRGGGEEWRNGVVDRHTYLESIAVHNPEHIVTPIPRQHLEAFRPAATRVQYEARPGMLLHVE